MNPISLQFSHINNANAFSGLLMLPISFEWEGDNVLVSGIPGKRITCYRLMAITAGDTVLTVKDGPNTSLTGDMPFLANSSLFLDISNVPWFQTSEGNDFILACSMSVKVTGAVYYQQK